MPLLGAKWPKREMGQIYQELLEERKDFDLFLFFGGGGGLLKGFVQFVWGFYFIYFIFGAGRSVCVVKKRKEQNVGVSWYLKSVLTHSHLG